MLNRLKILSILLFLGVLAACAPTTQGGSLYSAFDLSEEGPFGVTAGNSWYFSRSYPASYFDLDLGDIPDKAFDSGSVGSKYSQSVTKHFKIKTAGLPTDWTVKLQSAQGVQTLTDVSRTNRRTNLKWRSTVDFYFVVTVPQSTAPGRHTMFITATSDKGGDAVVPITVRVDTQTAGN